jgi:hypothetical protein
MYSSTIHVINYSANGSKLGGSSFLGLTVVFGAFDVVQLLFVAQGSSPANGISSLVGDGVCSEALDCMYSAALELLSVILRAATVVS